MAQLSFCLFLQKIQDCLGKSQFQQGLLPAFWKERLEFILLKNIVSKLLLLIEVIESKRNPC